MYNRNAVAREEHVDMSTTSYHPGTLFKAVAAALLIIIFVVFIFNWLKTRGYCLRSTNNTSPAPQSRDWSVNWSRPGGDSNAVQFVQPGQHMMQMVPVAGQGGNMAAVQGAGMPAPVMPVVPNLARN